MKIVILASGRGSNFEAIAKAEIPNTQILALISNKPEAPALQKAKALRIPTHVIANQGLNRETYEGKLLALLETLPFDYLCLTGYMLLLGKKIISRYPNRILNIHPSLLPAYPGLHAQKQALEDGAKATGCTVHFVTEEMDAGPIVMQSRIPILPNDTVESLSERLLPLEHATYISALQLLASKSTS